MKRKFCVDTLRVFNNLYADVVELVDTLALGASAARREGSSPFIRTKAINQAEAWFIALALSLHPLQIRRPQTQTDAWSWALPVQGGTMGTATIPTGE